jgi:hypothetical protein
MIRQNRMNYLMVSRVAAEVASLREAVRGLDPTFADVLAEKRSDAKESNSPFEQTVLQAYDQLLELVENGSVC